VSGRWRARLAALADAEQALATAQDALPPLPDRASLARLTADLPALWHAPATARDPKHLLRTLIANMHVLLSTPRHATRSSTHDPGCAGRCPSAIKRISSPYRFIPAVSSIRQRKALKAS
jgi:hypothetical protein